MQKIEFKGNVLLVSPCGASLLACNGEQYVKSELVNKLGDNQSLTAIPLPDVPESSELIDNINQILSDIEDGNIQRYPERYTISM